MGMLTETYPATVTANNDPDKRGRVRIACAALMGDEETELPMWVDALPQWGWFIVPDVGELIEIEVVTASSEDESAGQASIDNPDIKWRGARYYGNKEGPQPTDVPEDFTASNYGKRRGFATPGGHVMLFDDTEGDRKVSMSWKSGDDNKFTWFSIDKDGSLGMSTHAGHLVYMNAKKSELSIIDPFGNTYFSDKDGLKLMQADGNVLELHKNGNCQILAQKGITLNGGNVHLNAGEVLLGDGIAALITEFALLGTTFINLFANHTHPVPGVTAGAASVPSLAPIVGAGGNPALWIAALSTEVKLK